MEKKQLNFNAPLISARRYSSPVRSSERVNNAKIEKPFPHRQQSLPVQKPDWELSEVAEPGTVPFLWEKIPGKAKEEVECASQTNTPRLPPRIERTPLNISGNLLEMMKKGAKVDADDRSESGDDRFSDALDALSLSDSRSMSCSVSGLSGYCGSDVKSRESFSADVHTRDFMMNRFLPAAKAMILKTPHYSTKKHNVTVEQTKEVVENIVVNTQRRPSVVHDFPKIISDCGEYKYETESENGFFDEYETSRKTPRKVFGFFSRFCLKNSLCLLNPVPGMKARIQSHTMTPKRSSTGKSPAKDASKVIRKAFSGPLTQTTDKHSGGFSSKPKFSGGTRSQELYMVKHKPSGDSPRLSYSGELRMTRTSSPYRANNRGNLSPYRNEVVPTSPFRKGTSFFGVTKDGENVKVVKKPIIPKIEKKVYIDHDDIVKKPFSESISTKEETNAIVVNIEEISGDVSASLPAHHPPLPKTPSESWLWRTLPSINLGNSFSSTRSHFSSKTRHVKEGTKWETIVKTSNVHHDHMRYSEELVPHLSQHHKT